MFSDIKQVQLLRVATHARSSVPGSTSLQRNPHECGHGRIALLHTGSDTLEAGYRAVLTTFKACKASCLTSCWIVENNYRAHPARCHGTGLTQTHDTPHSSSDAYYPALRQRGSQPYQICHEARPLTDSFAALSELKTSTSPREWSSCRLRVGSHVIPLSGISFHWTWYRLSPLTSMTWWMRSTL